MSNAILTFSAIALLAVAGGAQAAGTPGGFPPPGQYRVDSEATRTTSAGMVQLTWVQRTDGATGDMTVTQRTSVDPQHATTQRYPGKGPDLRCFVLSSPPPSSVAACRDLQRSVGAAGATQTGSCNGLALDERWTRLDDRTWEHGLRVTDAAPSAATSPQHAIDKLAGDMTPAERAKLPVQVPADAKRAQAMNDLRAKLEAGARSANPQEAAAARQALQALQGGPVPQAGGGVVTVLKERWTRVADACGTAR